jgi:glycosyltransferase involved in cell wall biosynthesis
MVLVNAPSGTATAERAAWVAEAAGGATVVHRHGGRLGAAAAFATGVLLRRPARLYLVDCAVPTVLAALVARLTSRATVVLDTGDATAALVRSSGQGGVAGAWLGVIVERLGYRLATTIVVRSRGLAARVRAMAGRDSVVIPDGFDPKLAGIRDAGHLRRRWGIGDETIAIGVLGTARWNARLQWCYGRDVIEALARSTRPDVVGVLLVAGDGVPHLRSLAARRGVADRVLFVEPGRGAEAWDQLAALDVALSTQTNDAVGQARTTGKLAQYLAAGKYVLASRVGTAADVLPPEMLLEYRGAWDEDYFTRLATAVDGLPARPTLRALGAELVARADAFSYETLRRRWRDEVFRRPYVLVTGDFVKTGGMDMANFALADYAARQGREVHLVAHRVAPELASAPGVLVHRIPKPAGSYAAAAPFVHATGARWARRLSARAPRVLVNGGNCVWPATNWVHYVHAAYTPETRRGGAARCRRLLVHRMFLAFERAALRRASLVIANSARTATDLRVHLGVEPRRIRTIYYGIDAGRFYPRSPGERRAARQALGWAPDVPVVAFVGALGNLRKGFDTVFEAWSELAADPRWPCHLAVIGSGADAPYWKGRLERTPWAAGVHFLGFSSDVAGVLAACDALVSPTRYEAYGLAAHEALCSGLATFVTSAAGVAERVPPELGDFLIPDPRDARDVARRLRAWASGRERRRDAQLALAHALRRRSWDDMAAEILAAMEEVA